MYGIFATPEARYKWGSDIVAVNVSDDQALFDNICQFKAHPIQDDGLAFLADATVANVHVGMSKKSTAGQKGVLLSKMWMGINAEAVCSSASAKPAVSALQRGISSKCKAIDLANITMNAKMAEYNQIRVEVVALFGDYGKQILQMPIIDFMRLMVDADAKKHMDGVVMSEALAKVLLMCRCGIGAGKVNDAIAGHLATLTAYRKKCQWLGAKAASITVDEAKQRGDYDGDAFDSQDPFGNVGLVTPREEDDGKAKEDDAEAEEEEDDDAAIEREMRELELMDTGL